MSHSTCGGVSLKLAMLGTCSSSHLSTVATCLCHCMLRGLTAVLHVQSCACLWRRTARLPSAIEGGHLVRWSVGRRCLANSLRARLYMVPPVIVCSCAQEDLRRIRRLADLPQPQPTAAHRGRVAGRATQGASAGRACATALARACLRKARVLYFTLLYLLTSK